VLVVDLVLHLEQQTQLAAQVAAVQADHLERLTQAAQAAQIQVQAVAVFMVAAILLVQADQAWLF
jgi:hypothetical protein